jgi:Protein of unknown function (DUF4197)
MKKLIFIALLIPFIGIAQKKKTKTKVKTPTTTVASKADNAIADALKEALNNGITNQVSKLAIENGFYTNDLVKISVPDEAYLLEGTLRKIGQGKLVDDGIKSLNRAAEDAVKEAVPIFVTAIKNIKITDAKSILMGKENAATAYLETSTNKDLYSKLAPIVQASLGRLGADVLWKSLIDKYNRIPLLDKINPDVNDYVTKKTLEGAFKMIAVEEKNIRTNLDSRTSNALKTVFGMLEKK